jgi:prepilin-type N-terminal cleavage/methylation domain-containing protein
MKTKTSSAFTLIELLIVIAIIAILASIALPAFIGVQRRAKQTKDLSNGKQVAIALRQFALDNDGNFPNRAYAFNTSYSAATGALTTSNEAFRWLVPQYTTSEDIFQVPGSAWNPIIADNVYDTSGAGQTLKAGENGYSYVSALTDTSNPLFPIVQDGWSATIPNYLSDTSVQGGVWAGLKAVVIFVDGSGQVMSVDDRTNLSVFRPGSNPAYNLWSQANSGPPDNWLSTTNLLLNPE